MSSARPRMARSEMARAKRKTGADQNTNGKVPDDAATRAAQQIYEEEAEYKAERAYQLEQRREKALAERVARDLDARDSRSFRLPAVERTLADSLKEPRIGTKYTVESLHTR